MAKHGGRIHLILYLEKKIMRAVSKRNFLIVSVHVFGYHDHEYI